MGGIMTSDTRQTAVTAKIKKVRGGSGKPPFFIKITTQGGYPTRGGGSRKVVFLKNSFFKKRVLMLKMNRK